MDPQDAALLALMGAIATHDLPRLQAALAADPSLAHAALAHGATRTGVPVQVPCHGHVYTGDTLLHLAATTFQPEAAALLLAHGARVDAANRRGVQPLHLAAAGQPDGPATAQVAVIQLLLAHGADVNAANKDGATPLHKAVRTRCAAAVEALLQAGADPTRRNKGGSTPVGLAYHDTGRGGTGTPAARAAQAEIQALLGR